MHNVRIEYLKKHYDKIGDSMDASILIKDTKKLIVGKVNLISDKL